MPHAHRSGAPVSRLDEVGERDGWRCWICDEPVDPEMSVNDPRGPSVVALQPPLRDADPAQAPTQPVDAPRSRLDGFLVGDTVTVRSVRVPDGPDVLVGSDHRPAVLELEW